MTRSVVLLDLDGTVLDTGELILASWRHVRAQFGLDATDDAFRRGMGTPLVNIFGPMARDDAERDAMVAAYREHNALHHDAMVRPFPGVAELFDALHRDGRRVGIVTSKRRDLALRGLEVAGLRVHDLVGPDDVRLPKPDPEPVRLALHRFGAPPDAAVFVGDSPHDIHAGRGAGVLTVAVSWGMFERADLEAAAPDHWLEAPRDLLELLR